MGKVKARANCDLDKTMCLSVSLLIVLANIVAPMLFYLPSTDIINRKIGLGLIEVNVNAIPIGYIV